MAQRLEHIHLLRGLAILFIVLKHGSVFRFRNGEHPAMGRLYDVMIDEWTVVFLIISGFLFQFLLPRYEPRKYFISKTKNILLPYLVVSLPAVLIYVLGFKDSHAWVDLDTLREHSVLYQAAFFYATGAHLGPLWYIPFVVLIFLSSVWLSKLGRAQGMLERVMPLCVVIVAITSRPEDNSNPLVSYVHFAPVFVLGMYLCEKRDAVSNMSRGTFNILGLCFLALLALSMFREEGSIIVFQKILLFVLLCHVFEKKQASFAPWVRQSLSKLADLSFGIYFLHGYLIAVVRGADKMASHSEMAGLALNFGITLSAVLICSLSILMVQKLFRENSRIIVGC